MKWFAAAFTGWVVGWIVYAICWAVLAEKFAKENDDKRAPPWPVTWAMSVAFVVIALSWAGFFREVVPLPVRDDVYEQEP
jgi:hypothetical protein